MLKKEQLIRIQNALQSVQNNDGWVRLELWGKIISKPEVVANGYEKLIELLRDNSDYFEVRERLMPDINDVKRPPLFEARMKPGLIAPTISDDAEEVKDVRETPFRKNIYRKDVTEGSDLSTLSLRKSASISKKQLQALATTAQPEKWGGTGKSFVILQNYLEYTFQRLAQEDKVVKGNDYFLFNTGLLDALNFNDIYVVFKKNLKPDIPFGWYLLGSGTAEVIKREFHINRDKWPERAKFTNSVTDIVLPFDAEFDTPNLDHILIENLHRFPQDILKECKIPNEWIRKPQPNESASEREVHRAALRERFKLNQGAYRSLSSRFKDAIEYAIRRTSANFHIAVPIWHPKKGISFLLPLALHFDDPSKADLALLVNRDNVTGKYCGRTIYLLDWAYTYARVLIKPTDEWLNPEFIEETELEDVE